MWKIITAGLIISVFVYFVVLWIVWKYGGMPDQDNAA